MQRTALVSIILVAACGGPAEPAPTVHVVAPSVTLPAPGPPSAPLGLPKAAPLVVSFDLPTALAVLGSARDELGAEVGLPPGTLSSNLAELGADPKRPVTIAFAPLDSGESALVDVLAAGAAQASPAMGRDALDWLGHHPMMPSLRVLVPATNSAKLVGTLRTLLAKENWHADGGGFHKGHRVLALSSDASSVAIDLGAGPDARAAIAALQEAMRGATEPPPPLDGGVHATWSPVRLARYGFLTGLYKAAGAVSGASVKPDLRARIMAQALHEASALFTLSGDPAKPIVERVDLAARAEPFEVTVRAEPGPGFTMPSDAAWSAGTSVTFAGAKAELGESIALHDAWHVPSLQVARDGGWFSYFAGLPALLVAAPIEIPHVTQDAGPSESVARHFERIGESWTASGDAIWFGVLAPNTPRAVAQCSLTPDGKCAGATKLPVGKAVKAGRGFAKLVLLDHRFVLLLARESTTLGNAPKTVQAGPLHFEGQLKALAAPLALSLPLPEHVVAEASRDHGAILFRLAAP